MAGVPEEFRFRVMGGQANVWGEAIRTVFDLEWKMWPRACAIAEALWTGRTNRCFAEFKTRLMHHRNRLIRQHVNAAPVGDTAIAF